MLFYLLIITINTSNFFKYKIVINLFFYTALRQTYLHNVCKYFGHLTVFKYKKNKANVLLS